MRAALLLLLLVTACAAQTILKVRPQPAVNRTTVEVPLEKYVAAVVAGEASILRSDEALKAMAVAARTFGIYGRGRHAAEGYDLCGTTHCQRFDPTAVTPRIEAAVAATAGEMVWSAGRPAFTVYSQDCGGTTEDVTAVWPEVSAPYLRRQSDPYCVRGSSLWEWRAKATELAAALRDSQLRAPRRMERINVSARTASGRARELTLLGGGESIRISATAFRFAVGRALGWNTLRSDRYQVEGLEFHGSGSGHGVGLCQRGADQMGAQNKSYREILAFYYPGTLVGQTGRGIEWTRLGGERIALLTTHASRDGALLAMAEKELSEWIRQTNWSAPRGIEIRLYPDLDTFRDATGEPGWVAAHTAGRKIELQPAGAVRATVRHELLHVLVESNARPGLPVWFREGLVGYLIDRAVRPAEHTPADADLRQTADAARARRANGEASSRVAALVKRYGEPAVLSWVTAGMPKEAR